MVTITVTKALFLGLVQGLTEFLPVSSSGHLVIAHRFLGSLEDNVFFDVALHVGTLVATLVFFRARLVSLATGGWRELRARQVTSGPMLARIFYIFLAVVPTGVIGIEGKDRLESLFGKPDIVCLMLMVTGLVLLATRFVPAGQIPGNRLGAGRALLVGIIQGLAIIPGISRSGSTISAGLLLKLERKEAGEFSFLISIPAILGALLIKLGDIGSLQSLPWEMILAGFATSLITGMAALYILMRFVVAGQIWVFAPYCLLVGLGGFIIFTW
jgi:undecaprenyl-diphosphatase